MATYQFGQKELTFVSGRALRYSLSWCQRFESSWIGSDAPWLRWKSTNSIFAFMSLIFLEQLRDISVFFA